MTKELNYSWLRQNKEPESMYKWFTYYRDMRGTRRLNKIVDEMKTKEPYLERYPTYNEIKKASSNWKWRYRCVDYDNYMQLQLIESHKQTLIIYEEESINIDKKIFNALNTEIDTLIRDTELPPEKKIRALKEAQILNKELVGGIEHIANIEVPEIRYIDVDKTRQNEIVQSLINNAKGIITADEVTNITDGVPAEEVIRMINSYIATENNSYIPTDKYTEVKYNGNSYSIPDR